MKTIKIKPELFIETVSEMAEKVVHLRFGESALVEEENGDTRYTEEAQDYFNTVYDTIENSMFEDFDITMLEE